MANDLGLKVIGSVPIGMVNGEITNFPAALAIADIEGNQNRTTVIIGEGFPVLGIGTLAKFGYKATIDCKHKIVTLEKA